MTGVMFYRARTGYTQASVLLRMTGLDVRNTSGPLAGHCIGVNTAVMHRHNRTQLHAFTHTRTHTRVHSVVYTHPHGVITMLLTISYTVINKSIIKYGSQTIPIFNRCQKDGAKSVDRSYGQYTP